MRVGIRSLVVGIVCEEDREVLADPVDRDFGLLLDEVEEEYAQAAVFALPVVVGRHRNAVLAADVGHLQAGIGFLEDGDNLGFGESALFHGRSGGP